MTKKTTYQEGIIHKTFQKIVKKISNVLKGYKKIDKNNTKLTINYYKETHSLWRRANARNISLKLFTVANLHYQLSW